ncbi:MAG: hypothetical protein EZS28_048745 [Streblomastix strix]|uniref:Uncharacterized protein n=1 Tax=Streblomastix strix TaxID=222440 RepID=A0A5J4TC68_9EUKA|nr:MAG: hypothetical protein EZS28_048745 [Streblomastix strix]
MLVIKGPETSPGVVTDESGLEREHLQTPLVFGRERKAEKINLVLLQRLEAKYDDDDEIMLAITDTYMNNIDLSVAQGELSGRIFILENDDPIAEVRDSGIVNDLRIEIHHDQLQFESTEEEIE